MGNDGSGLWIIIIIIMIIIFFRLWNSINNSKTGASASIQSRSNKSGKNTLSNTAYRTGHFWHGEDSDGNYYIDLRSLIVYTWLNNCPESWQNEPEIITIIPIIKRDGTVIRAKVKGRKCEGGRIIFIKDTDYYRIVNTTGNVLGQTTDWYGYTNLGATGSGYLDRYINLQEKSKFKLFGYNVTAADNFSAEYRQTVLMFMIESGLTTISEAVGFLEFNIANHLTRTRSQKAVQKWQADRAFLLRYKYDESRINWVTKNNHPA